MESGQTLARPSILPLKVNLSDLDIKQGHANVLMAEQLLEGGETNSGPQHLCGVGVAKPMRSNVSRATRLTSSTGQALLEGCVHTRGYVGGPRQQRAARSERKGESI